MLLLKVILLTILATVHSATTGYDPEFARGSCILQCFKLDQTTTTTTTTTTPAPAPAPPAPAPPVPALPASAPVPAPPAPAAAPSAPLNIPELISDIVPEAVPEARALYYRNSVRGGEVMKCIADCIEQLADSIKDMIPDKENIFGTETRRTTVQDLKEKATVMDKELISLKKLFEAPPVVTEILSIIPGLHLWAPAQTMPITPMPFSANPPPISLLQSLIQALRQLLDHIVKRNQEFVQLVIGCGNSTDTTTTTTTTTTAPPVRSVDRNQKLYYPTKNEADISF